jgi:drug/metabolite transporter (DMT)-like permease
MQDLSDWGTSMAFLTYFSEGTGLTLLIVGLIAALAGIGVVVYRSERKQYFGNILLPCSLIALAAIFFAITFSFPMEEAGPAVVPYLWIFWTVLLCGVILWQIFRGTAEPDPKPGRFAFLALVTALLIVYYFAIQYLGYFLSSFLFLIVVMHVLAYERKRTIYIIAVGWVIFSYIVFYRVLYIQLPLGKLFENYF